MVEPRREADIDLLEIIDQLEDAVLSGRSARFGGGWVVDREQLLDTIDRLRATAPASLEQAQQLVGERDRVLEEAREEAQIIVNRAQQEAEMQIGAHELVVAAQQRADEILERAGQSSREAIENARAEAAAIRGSAATDAVEQALEADRYSLELLRRLAEQLNGLGQNVNNSVNALELKLAQAQEARDLDIRDAESPPPPPPPSDSGSSLLPGGRPGGG